VGLLEGEGHVSGLAEGVGLDEDEQELVELSY
jgi:hypothetical protein